MRFARRSVAALSTVLLLQLSLLGSGTLCALRHAAAPSNPERLMEAMKGMSHETVTPVGKHVSSVMNQAEPGSQDAGSGCPSSDHEPCRGPWAPGTCASMGACAWSQIVSFEPTRGSVRNSSAATRIEPLMLHAGPAFAPEIPPPRA